MERTVAGEVNNPAVRTSELCAYGCPVSVSHGAKAAACKEMSRLLVVYVLRRPHLMLTYVRNIYGIIAGFAAYCFDDLLRIQHIIVACNPHRVLLIPCPDLRYPFRMVCALYFGYKLLQHVFAVAYYSFVYCNVFADLALIYIDLKYFCL